MGQTIRQIAQQNHINRQTVYNWLKRDGRPLDLLKDKATGQLTDIGMEVVQSKLTVKPFTVEQVDRSIDRQTAELTAQLQTLRTDLATTIKERDEAVKERDTYKMTCDILQAKVDGATGQVALLESQVAFLRDQLQRVTTPKLTGQTSTSRRLTWRERLTGHAKG